MDRVLSLHAGSRGFFPLDVLDEIWDLIESVSEGFLTYSLTGGTCPNDFSDPINQAMVPYR